MTSEGADPRCAECADVGAAYCDRCAPAVFAAVQSRIKVKPDGTVPAPSDEAVEAAARTMWESDEARYWALAHELDRAQYRRSALIAATAAYAIDLPRREAEVRAEERAKVQEDEDSAGAELSRIEADMLDIHDALVEAGFEGMINADSIIERIEELARGRAEERAATLREVIGALEMQACRTQMGRSAAEFIATCFDVEASDG